MLCTRGDICAGLGQRPLVRGSGARPVPRGFGIDHPTSTFTSLAHTIVGCRLRGLEIDGDRDPTSISVSISDPWRLSTHSPSKPKSSGLNLQEGYSSHSPPYKHRNIPCAHHCRLSNQCTLHTAHTHTHTNLQTCNFAHACNHNHDPTLFAE